MNIVEKIHQEIDTAQERLIEQAEQIISQTSLEDKEDEKNILSKAERLSKLGFTNTEEVKEAFTIKKEKKKKENIVVNSRKEAELIKYYSSRYPFQKFLTEAEMIRICEKYDLVYAPAKNYCKTVPEKNLKDIETCQPLDNNDKFQTLYKYIPQKGWNFEKILEFLGNPSGEFTQQDLTELVKKYWGSCPKDWDKPGSYMPFSLVCDKDPELLLMKRSGTLSSSSFTWITAIKSGLFIAAPKSHFNLADVEKQTERGFFTVIKPKPEPKDPIVFEFCRGNIIRVLTKWGPEAEDSKLTVPITN